ncbi:MAG TPA: hypothetical protein PLF10_11175, partial [Dokdonella sp.]|nr:hypothetical protein [Dokdonella sp.]
REAISGPAQSAFAGTTKTKEGLNKYCREQARSHHCLILWLIVLSRASSLPPLLDFVAHRIVARKLAPTIA